MAQKIRNWGRGCASSCRHGYASLPAPGTFSCGALLLRQHLRKHLRPPHGAATALSSSKLRPMADKATLIFTQNTKLTHLSKYGRINEAIILFDTMTTRNTVTNNSMIFAYAKNGRLSAARRLFDCMPSKNTISYNTMIPGYSHNSCILDAHQLFDTMPHRDAFSLTLMITCNTRNNQLDKAIHLLDRMPNKSNPAYAACFNAMIAGYAKNRMFEAAAALLREMPVSDLVSWNSLLAGYTHNCSLRAGV